MLKTQANRARDRSQMMLNDRIPGLIFRMAMPTIVAFIINSIYSLADTYFVSGLGTDATAAVSVNASLDQFIMMAGSMLAVGGSSYISRLLGANEREKANQVLSTAFFLALGFGLLVLLFGSVFMRPMVRLLGATPGACEDYSVDYATYVLLVAPFMATSFVMNQSLRAEGSAMLSMIGMGFGGILNVALDPIFINTLDMGVKGASIATAISKLVSFAILIFPYLRRKTSLHLTIRRFKPTRRIMYEIVSVGSSAFLRNALNIIAAIILNHLAGAISNSVMAGTGVATKIMMFPFSIILGFSQGFLPVAGFNWGARVYGRVKESFRFASIVAIVGGLVMGGILVIFAEEIISLFSETDAEMMRLGALCIRLQSIALPIHAWCAVVNQLCSGIGYASGALLIATSRQGTCFIPFAFLLAWLFGGEGVAATQAVADIVALILALPIARVVLNRIKIALKEQKEASDAAQ